MLSPIQTQIVKSTVPILKQHGGAITTLFYKNMLAAHPDLRNVFNLSNQRNGAQPKALAGAVLAYASYIDKPEVLAPAIERIAHKHVSLGIAPDQYPIVGKHLIEAIGQVLGDGLTPEVAEAWAAAYGQLAEIFIKREGDLYDEAGEWRGWRKFKIVRREPESKNVTSFYLAPSDGRTPLPKFNPGQYISLRVKVDELDGIHQCRQYSMSAAPQGGYYRVSVKRESGATADALTGVSAPGVVSNILHDKYQGGDEIELTFPRGEFFIDVQDATKSDQALVLLSAGVGATSLVSIFDSVLKSPESKMTKRPILWAHMARNSQELAFGQHMRRASRENGNVSSAIFLNQVADSDKKGVEYDFEGTLDLDLAFQHATLSPKIESSDFYICGPAPWMVATRSALETLGVEKDRIHLELFGTGDAEDN